MGLPKLMRPVLGLVILAAAPAGAADPFYENLLRKGSDAYSRREYPTAVRQLRLACFGFLDEPELLADGLVRLALAQAALGDRDGFVATFQRIVEVEERFAGYSKAATPPEVRAAFEKFVTTLIPAAALQASAAFARLSPQPSDRVASLPPKERRKELERLLRVEPQNEVWQVMLAELEMDEGRLDRARRMAADVLKTVPTSRQALRVYGLVMAASGEWAQAISDLRASGSVLTDVRVAETVLRALVELGRWSEASDLAAELPAPLRQRRQIAELEGRAREMLQRSQAPVPRPAPAESSASVSSAVAPAAATPGPLAAAPVAPVAAKNANGTPATETPAVTEQEAERLRELARGGALGEAYEQAKALVAAHPTAPEALYLAAELAYRESRWSEALELFRQAGDPGDEQPLLLFYLAVTLHETGAGDEAAAVLRRCLPNISRSPYVEEYVEKILGPAGRP
jgi:predicted Zn-dependent protease